MKVMPVGSIIKPLTPAQQQQYMPSEVPATLKHYLDGTIEQFWVREKSGPIFLMNVDSVEQAKAALDGLTKSSAARPTPPPSSNAPPTALPGAAAT